jgi:hypothetical protein
MRCEAKIAVTQSGILAPFYAQCVGGAGHAGMHFYEQPDFDLVGHRLNGPPMRLRGTARIGWDDPDTYGDKAQAYILNGLTLIEGDTEREPDLTVQPYEVRPWLRAVK